MNKNNDEMIDKKFRKWTVLSFSRRTEKVKLYNCVCDCGTKREVSSYKLKKGKTNSCGCGRSIDMKDKKFGRLTFKEKIGLNKQDEVIWKCECECGNIVERTYNQIVNHKIISCGCYASEKAREIIEKNREKLKRAEGTCINSLNQKKSKNNTSGVKGVHWDKSRNKWAAQIMFKGKNYSLGRYDKLEDAAAARQTAEEEIYGNFIDGMKRKENSD